MSLEIRPAPIPLQADAEGTLRVGGTRVTLDSVVAAFQAGETAEEIVTHYPVLKLADVYFVLGFYLQHRVQVETYLGRRRQEAEQLRELHEQGADARLLRERLLAHRRSAG